MKIDCTTCVYHGTLICYEPCSTCFAEHLDTNPYPKYQQREENPIRLIWEQMLKQE